MGKRRSRLVAVMAIALGTAPLGACSAPVADPAPASSHTGSAREQRAMARLRAVQQTPGSTLSEFTTDGCSGGLSAGWAALAQALPAFRSRFGDRPPYESCCETHDRAYWTGATEDGYGARHAADEALRACVRDYGSRHRAKFASDFGISEEQIVRNFEIISTLMYDAVRLGGGPCTALPWRWGYGWPQCPSETEAKR